MSGYMKAFSILLSLGIVAIGLVAFLSWSRHPERFPLKAVEVRAELKQVRAEEIEALVAPFLAEGFFWVNVGSVQAQIKTLPWVESAEVRRSWPDRLIVSVREQTPLARWKDNGVISIEGEIFYPELSTISSHLPQFIGPEDRSKEMLQNFHTLLELLGPTGLSVQTLEMASNGSSLIVLGNGIKVVIGKTAMNERLARFILAYSNNLQAQMSQIAYIDLRYTNGFAIGWKSNVQ